MARAELAQQRQPGVEGAGHAGGEQPGAGDEVEPELAEALDRRGGGRRALAADDEHVVPRSESRQDRQVAAGPVQVRLDDLEHEPAATAASNALPPRSSVAIPAADASQCVEATMPKVPRARAVW